MPASVNKGNLGFCFPAQPLGLFPLGLSGDVGNHLVLIIPLSLGRPEQASPTLASGLEVLHGLIQDLLEPAWFVPRGAFEFSDQCTEDGLGLVAGGDQGCLLGQARLGAGFQFQRRRDSFHVKNLSERVAQVLFGLR